MLICFLLAPFSTHAVEADFDQDGLSDVDEKNKYFTDYQNPDTDDDGYNDGEEIANDYSPRFAGKRLIEVDSDKDYLNDKWELILGTGLMDPDTDGDKYLDGTEVAAGFDPLNISPDKKIDKLIKVDLSQQRLWYYFGDKLFDTFLISGGLPGLPTPRGEFSVLAKVPVKDYGGPGYWLPNTKWNLHFTTTMYRYYIHGAYWHDNFGRPMSHGCVNVSYKDMENLYWFAQLGTKIVIE